MLPFAHLQHRAGALLLWICALALAGPAAALPQDADPGRLDALTTSPAVFGTVSDFELLDRAGQPLGSADLLGRPWLVGFVFTRCSTICPGLVIEMSRAQEALVDLDVDLVSISVDPEHDTPQVLGEFAANFRGTDSDAWHFLTGDEESTYELIRSSFHLAIERDPGADPGVAISHSARLVAIDGTGAIRGYYDASSQEGTDRAIQRMRFLAGDRSGLSQLPRTNAVLNATAAVLLGLGFIAIKSGRKRLHAGLMRSAFGFSAAFLASYLYYHFVVVPAQGGPVRFAGDGPARVAYLVLLVTHVVGAVVNLPMVLRTLWLAHRERWEAHRRLARWTFPLWMYVSVTGVIVYVILYRI